MGCVSIRVWRNDKLYFLDCYLIFNEEIRLIFGFKLCLVMNIIQYKGNDLFNKFVIVWGFFVYKVDDQKLFLIKEELMLKFLIVFRNVRLNLEKLKL